MHSIFAIALGIVLSLFTYDSVSTLTTQSQTTKLSLAEASLVRSSRAAIIDTGISAPYFDRHFKLVRVIDTVSDRRVIWKYSIGDYVAALNDAVGFYTNEKGQRVNIHSVRNTLSTAHDITKTIPKKRAQQMMLQCIGKYTLGSVVFQSFGPALRASLLFTASSVAKSHEGRSKEERKESEKNRKEKEDQRLSEGKSSIDTVEEEDDEGNNDRPPIFTGFVDLETGMCTKGVAQAGHPVPVKR